MISSLGSVKNHIGVSSSDTSEDLQLAQWLVQADQLLKTWANQKIEFGTYTRYLSGFNTPKIRLPQRPVVAVTSVYLDRAGFWGQGTPTPYAAATILTAGTDYALQVDQDDGTSRSGLLVRINGVWPATITRRRNLLAAGLDQSPGPIKVAFTAGFATVPADIELACNLTVAALRYRKNGFMPVQSESYENYSYSLAARKRYDLIPAEAKQIISTYYSRLFLYG